MGVISGMGMKSVTVVRPSPRAEYTVTFQYGDHMNRAWPVREKTGFDAFHPALDPLLKSYLGSPEGPVPKVGYCTYSKCLHETPPVAQSSQ